VAWQRAEQSPSATSDNQETVRRGESLTMDAQPKADCPKDTVILVHGLAAPPLVMTPLARSLEKHFAEVVNWAYPSLWSRIERHGLALAQLLRQADKSGRGRIHLITHSMGGIIARVALAEYMPRRLGRLVMIAPPNRGSHVARRLAPFLGRICPPLVQLTDHDASFVCQLAKPAIRDLGIIAADGDFMVLEPNTRLGCEADHIVLPGLHSSLLWRTETAEQARHFIEYGRFKRKAD
jgi:pimeloyl-ACP methyl ester carboxylesterase